jgi:hypothetical protein
MASPSGRVTVRNKLSLAEGKPRLEKLMTGVESSKLLIIQKRLRVPDDLSRF